MFVLVTYDVNTQSPEGKRRLRQIAKACQNYGQRVQNSVFECVVDAAQCATLKHQLEGIIDKESDSLRFYYLGNHYKAKMEHMGTKESIDMEGTLVL